MVSPVTWAWPDPLDHEVKQLQGRGVGPVQVLVEFEHRPLARETGELLNQNLQGALLLLLRAEIEGRVARLARDAEQRPDQRHRLLQPIRRPREQRLQLLQLGRRPVVGRQGGRPLQLRDGRMQRAVGVVGRAEVPERDLRPAGHLLAQRPQQARFADPRLAGDQHHLAVALPGPGQALHQHRQLVLAPDQRRQALPVQGLETALGGAVTQHPPGPDRLVEPLEIAAPEILELEQAAHQASTPRVDDDPARCGQRLQSGGPVRRLADHRLLLRSALADQVADHDQTGRDPGAHSQRRAVARAELSDPGGQIEPGPHRPLGVVFVRLRPAEIREHTVAHVLGDMAVPALHYFSAALLILPDQLAQVLGIEPCRERRRADQIAEHHRQLPPLGGRGRRRQAGRRIGVPRGRGLAVCEIRDRTKQQAPMAEGEAELLEVFVGQLGQDLGRDITVAKRLFVALQP
jgi:hypothetical protein